MFPFTSPRQTVVTRISTVAPQEFLAESSAVACCGGQFNYTSLQLPSIQPCFILFNPSLLCTGITFQLDSLPTHLYLRLCSQGPRCWRGLLQHQVWTTGRSHTHVPVKRQFSIWVWFLNNMERSLVVMLFLPFWRLGIHGFLIMPKKKERVILLVSEKTLKCLIDLVTNMDYVVEDFIK